jgi:peroxiredoxin Q/BCP
VFVSLAGSPFPSFTLATDTGELLSLSSLRGRTVVLYFYPKDDTSGCTMESCEFRDLFPRFATSDAVILGISPDDVASHRKFKAKYSLPFTLLVDADHRLADALGIWVEKSLYGRKYMGVQRTTYIIGGNGIVQHIFEKVNPAGHADEVAAIVTPAAPAPAMPAAAPAESAPAAPAAAPSAPKAPAAKKPAAKKPAAKKPAAKKPAAKKPAAKKPAKKVAKKPAKKVVKKVAKKPAKKVAKKVAKKPAKKVVKAAKKATKKATKKAAKKAAKRAKKPAGKK